MLHDKFSHHKEHPIHSSLITHTIIVIIIMDWNFCIYVTIQISNVKIDWAAVPELQALTCFAQESHSNPTGDLPII